MKLQPPAAALPACVFHHSSGSGFEARVSVGSGKTRLKEYAFFPPGTDVAVMATWVEQARERLTARRAINPPPDRDTLGALVRRYFADVDLTPTTTKVRRQRLAWWMAQPVARDAAVLSVETVTAEAEARARGEATPDRGRTIGDVRVIKRDKLATIDADTLKRIREILRIAFAPTDRERNPTEFAQTSNHYRAALVHLFSVINVDVPAAVNPLATVAMRPTPGPTLAGQDMRIVREILKEFPTGHGRTPTRSLLRLAVLAYVPITPMQLSELDPLTMFHDVPDATREDMIAGAITLTKTVRRKGRMTRVPPPETISLTPYGVAAMRALADKRAWGRFSCSPLNDAFKAAAARVQANLTARGVPVDLAGMTLYHLKHSLGTAVQIASGGVVDAGFKVKQNPGLVKAFDHHNATTTAIYTAAAVSPLVREAMTALSRYLDDLFERPLVPVAPLRVIKGGAAE